MNDHDKLPPKFQELKDELTTKIPDEKFKYFLFRCAMFTTAQEGIMNMAKNGMTADLDDRRPIEAIGELMQMTQGFVSATNIIREHVIGMTIHLIQRHCERLQLSEADVGALKYLFMWSMCGERVADDLEARVHYDKLVASYAGLRQEFTSSH